MERQAQIEIDWTRSQQIGLIKRLDLPKLEKLTPDSDRSTRASNTACKAVLKAIDDYGRGKMAWPSQATLALDTDFSKRQVATAIARLRSFGLIAIDKRKLPSGQVGNVYSIVWSELAVRQQSRDRFAMSSPTPAIETPVFEADRDAVTALRSGERDAVCAERDAVCAERDAVCAERDAVCAERDAVTAHKALGSVKKPPPTERLVAGESEISILLREVGVARWQPMAAEFEGREGEVRHAVETWRANRHRIGPGAVVAFLREGVWPVEGLTDPATAAAARSAMAVKRRREAADRDRFLAYREARAIGRDRSWSADQVDQYVSEILEGST